MMGGMVVSKRPKFSRDQIISSSDLQRKWKDKIVPKLTEHPYLMMLSGNEPKAAVMSYDQFEAMWDSSQEAGELRFQLEVMSRVLSQLQGKGTIVPLAELVAEANVSPEELEGDIDVESEPE